MRVAERRERILELLAEHRRLTVEALARQLGTSQETIRRDLTELAARDRLRKFHGGAVLPERMAEGAFAQRMTENQEAKQAIGEAAAPLFGPGETLFIDTGSTTLAFAAALARQDGLTVITNSIGIAQHLSRGGGNRAFLLGGEHRHDAGENVGSLVLQQLSGFQPDHAVLTVGGITADGLHDFDLQEAEIARGMIERARRVTVLADASKFGRPALFRLCGLPAIARLVTERAPPPPLQAALQAAGVEVILAAGAGPRRE
ncbi:DeoR/GlpR family DNA-binding transcription regulator [Roseomonas sp. GC11]|uniref:DeoR/GlpR family DNA-binding transcription regulator n=1 Tax=Roseomonas sp. GC11 TaxID=2950546 RepID=UPI00210AEF54|nr:DeoR/GlpR family DNA-binding transcription regulator [Roseomonas sp. GC11]MCQ4159902.1 DeoR/GlpR family DNA-binding transcription regulator [Roseomonas sp. GC11]